MLKPDPRALSRRKRIVQRGAWVDLKDNERWVGRVEAFLGDGRVQVALFDRGGSILLGRVAVERPRLLVRDAPEWVASITG